jgi:hypothetical protein
MFLDDILQLWGVVIGEGATFAPFAIIALIVMYLAIMEKILHHLNT